MSHLAQCLAERRDMARAANAYAELDRTGEHFTLDDFACLCAELDTRPSWTCPSCRETVVATAGAALEELEALSWRHECIVGARS